MTYKPTAEEVAEYFRDAVTRYDETEVSRTSGQTIFSVTVNFQPRIAAELVVEFSLFYSKGGGTNIRCGDLITAIEEAERRHLGVDKSVPMKIERYPLTGIVTYGPPASIAPPATDDEIPF